MNAILRVTALGALLVLVLAACGEDPAIETVESNDDAATEDPAQDPDDPAAPVDEPEVVGTLVGVAATDLGDVVVDGDGMTLYLFEPDAQAEPTCYDDCAAAWPPFVTDGTPVSDNGADTALLGTVEREDGEVQITYDGWPLYYWAGDEAPGDTTGQGVNDVWWVLAPDGSPVRDDASAGDASAGDEGTDLGY